MSRKPPRTNVRDARLAPFHNRGGLTTDPRGGRGEVFVQVEIWWTTSGRLWRRRFSAPTALARVWMVLPGGAFHDYLLPAQDIAELVDDWTRGELGTFNGVRLQVRWLDREQSDRIRMEMGLGAGTR